MSLNSCITVFSMILSSVVLSAERVQEIHCYEGEYTAHLYYYTGLMTGWKKFDFTDLYHDGERASTGDPSWIPGYTGACMFGTRYDEEKETLHFGCWREISKYHFEGDIEGSVHVKGKMKVRLDENGYLLDLVRSDVELKILRGNTLWSKGQANCKVIR